MSEIGKSGYELGIRHWRIITHFIRPDYGRMSMCKYIYKIYIPPYLPKKNNEFFTGEIKWILEYGGFSLILYVWSFL